MAVTPAGIDIQLANARVAFVVSSTPLWGLGLLTRQFGSISRGFVPSQGLTAESRHPILRDPETKLTETDDTGTERTRAPNLLRALGLPIGCWGLTLGASVMLGVLVTFHELVSPFTIPDVVALVGQVVAGLALFLSWSWGYRLGWIVSMYLCVLGTFLMVAPPPEYSEPNLILGSAMFGWVYLAPGALLLLGLVAPASKRWHDDRSGSPRQPVQ